MYTALSQLRGVIICAFLKISSEHSA